MQLPRVALVALVLPHAAALAVRPKLTALRPGPNLRPPARVDPTEPPGPRDVVIKLYDISTPELCKAMSLLASKPAYWFPKLSVGVGRRTWSYDGEPEETYDAIIQNAAGGPPLRTWNCGATALSDAEIDAEIARMGATDYAPQEYDFFLRNCNHFCYDLAERLAGPLADANPHPHPHPNPNRNPNPRSAGRRRRHLHGRGYPLTLTLTLTLTPNP